MADVTNVELAVYGIVNFIAAIFSGIAGAGGGFISTPLLIFLGLNPAQAVATGKLGGLSISIGSLGGIGRIHGHSKRQLIVIAIIATIIGLIAPFIIVHLESDIYRRVIGIVLLAMIPVLIFKKVGHISRETSKRRRIIGYLLLILTLAMQAVFSGGMGTLVAIVLMAFMGMSALQANVTKRYSQLVLNTVVVLGLLGSGLIIWRVALVGIASAGLGGFIGGHIAAKKGNTFVMSIFVVFMLVSGVALLLT